MKTKGMSNKTRKTVAAIIAATLAAIVILSGTFAWQSINQEAKNETAAATKNMGGRLHDDFDGNNKDVYVENFTSPTENGVPIFARIRLDEYMELGADAGTNKDAAHRNATSLVAGAKINDVSTWTTHIPKATGQEGTCDNGNPNTFHDYWTWKMGGETVFMPTFNKNKDSLKADINGTYAGLNGNPYDDYVAYTEGETKKDNAIYDNDDNDIDDDNVITKEETHTAKKTQSATVITMEDWKNAGRKSGKFWVYDVDGWAYWAEAIQPGEATGLLIDSITQDIEPIEDWYYAINVVAQFATAGDWGEDDNTGFFDTTKGVNPTKDAMFLLNQAAGEAPKVTISEQNGNNSVNRGNTLNFNATLTLVDVQINNQKVTWYVEGASSADTNINTDGLLTIGMDEQASEIVVKAVSEENNKGIGTYKVTVTDPVTP